MLTIVMDLQWGSTGKGKLAGRLAFKDDVVASSCDFQPNTGHTFVREDGHETIVHQVPIAAAVKPDCIGLINAGAAIRVDTLLEEIEKFDLRSRLVIHPGAVIVDDACIKYEQEHLARISSTLRGCGAARGLKAMRHPDVRLARDEPRLRPWLGETSAKLRAMLKAGAPCMIEGAQGYDLSLNFGLEYPYVTGRDVTPHTIASAAGVPMQSVDRIFGAVRTFPIRVGNTYDEKGERVGWSGPHYDDQVEMSWEDMERESGGTNLTERTTTTRKVRRVFTWSWMQFYKALHHCAPTHLFINFINHIDAACAGARTVPELTHRALRFVDAVQAAARPCKVALLGTGANDKDMVDLGAS